MPLPNACRAGPKFCSTSIDKDALSINLESTKPTTSQSTMAPKRQVEIQRGSRGGYRAPKGYFASTYDALTSQENAAMVKSIAAFGVSSSSFLQSAHRPSTAAQVPDDHKD